MKLSFFIKLNNFPVKYFSLFFFITLTILFLSFPPFSLFPSVASFFETTKNYKNIPDSVNKIDTSIEKIEHQFKVKDVLHKNKKQKEIPYKKVVNLDNHCLEKIGNKCKKRALDNFYQKLTTSSFAKIKISYFGDSIISGDHITATLRKKLQKYFGCGGTGYLPLVKAWKWVKNKQIFFTSKDWTINSIVKRTIKDKIYGYGGISVKTIGSGAYTSYKCKHCCNPITEINIHYLTHPDGGKFEVLVGDNIRHIINTKAPKKKFQNFKVISKKKFQNFKIKVLSGYIRLFGVFVDSDKGIILDSISLTGGRFIHLTQIDRKTWLQSIKYRSPDLLIFHFGTNESDTGIGSNYKKNIVTFLGDLQKTLPNSSCLIISTTDKVSKKSGFYTTKPIIKKILKLQKDIANKSHCAFLNLWEIMGGESSAYTWYKHKPKLISGDLTHFNDIGAAKIGNLIYLKLMQEYLNYKNHNN